jgi:hypothetical protein
MWHAGPYHPDNAASPSVAVGHAPAGDWMVEVHETSTGQVAYYVGPPGEFGSAMGLEAHGARPRVAGDSSGAVVEVNQGQTEAGSLRSRVARITVAGGHVAATWTPPIVYGSGYHPAVAALAGQAVEIDMTDASGSGLEVRTGRYEGSGNVVWNAARLLDTPGPNPALAIAASEGGGEPLVVEAHQKDAKYGDMLLRVGRLGRDGTIVWKEAHPYDQGVAPSIAVFGKTIVELHQGQDENGSLWLKIGTIGDDGIASWRMTKKYDEGGHPVIALDPVGGRGLESHEGGTGFSALWGHDIDVY